MISKNFRIRKTGNGHNSETTALWFDIFMVILNYIESYQLIGLIGKKKFFIQKYECNMPWLI